MSYWNPQFGFCRYCFWTWGSRGIVNSTH
jgi:hypothetical protein